MTVAQVKKEMGVFPLDWVETIDALPRQHIITFSKTIGGEKPPCRYQLAADIRLDRQQHYASESPVNVP